MRRKRLSGWNYRGVPAWTAKQIKWMPMLIQAEAGNVFMIGDEHQNRKWKAAWLDDVAAAPYGAHDDQLDAVAGGLGELTPMQTSLTC